MENFQIKFTHPWLLLLLVLAFALTFIPHFRLNKRYRKNRNRITSMVLHLLIMLLSITVLAGFTVQYDVPNTENEILLLVDASYSGRDQEENKDDFVRSVIDEANSKFKLGVVTFGYDQVYAAELTTETGTIYDKYINAERPDISATNIAGALSYARTLFTHPEGAKIVLISDGIETDGRVSSVIRSIAAEGIRVDTVYFSKDRNDDEVQLIEIVTPDKNIIAGDTFELKVTVQSAMSGDAQLVLYDNDKEVLTQDVKVTTGVQTFTVEYSFALPGMHALSFALKCEGDTLMQNNNYNSYIYLEVFDKILIVENYQGESDNFKSLMADQYKEKVVVVNVHDSERMPTKVEQLQEYDEVILVNIANADIEPIGFDKILQKYVREIGGGLFTIGGNKEGEYDQNGNPVANTYNRSDMIGSIYQDMLPVQAVDYTPPVGVVIIIDRSGSMSSTDGATGKSFLELAKEGARSALRSLTERDWCGVVTLEDSYSADVDLIPLPEQEKIVAAIDSIESGGGTVFSSAIDYSGRALAALSSVERRHMILITDGMPSDNLDEDYGPIVKRLRELNGITLSVVGIGVRAGSAAAENMTRLTSEEFGNGHFYSIMEGDALITALRTDLNVSEIKDFNPEDFQPTIATHTSVTRFLFDEDSDVTEKDLPILGGFYGTKLKQGAEAILKGPYVPVYAQWKYGKGSVGSFMCDLKGGNDSFANEFLQDEKTVSSRLINNIIESLFPVENIRPSDIKVTMTEDNYTTNMSVYTSALKEGETLEVTVTGPVDEETGEENVQTIVRGANDDYTRISFENKLSGMYNVLLQKKDANGEVIAEYLTYKAFSYSEEYDEFTDPEEYETFLTEVSELGKGKTLKINEYQHIFDEFVKYIHRIKDPRIPFIIATIVLLLLDIAVRKFKFKWPHELIRDYKEKKASKKS